MKLVLPSSKYKKSYFELVDEAKNFGDYKELGNALVRDNESYESFIKRLKDRRIGKNIHKRDVAATVYFIVVNNEVVGTIDLRHYLNQDYFERLGHIAYYIKPSQRNKGYATIALSIAKKKYYNKYAKNILITCYSDNIASSKVIEKNGGVLEKKIYDELSKKYISRYIISIRNDDVVVPKTAWLTTNRTCNNKCNWCYANNCSDKIMNFEDIKKYVNSLSKVGINKIILIGGEPTIYDDIVKTIKYISNKGINVSMASNGRMFSNYRFAKKLVDSGLKTCNISIKGSDEDEYLKNTNSIGFNQMVEGYKNLKKLAINVSTSYVLCDNDYEKFDKFWNSFVNNGIDNIVFQLYKPSVEGETYEDAPSISDLADMCKYVFSKVKDTNIKYSFEMSIPLCSMDEQLLNEMIEKKCITTCCHIGKGSGIIFDSNFNILPCNHFVNHPLNTKRIVDTELISFWNSKTCGDFRKIINTYPHELCQNCSKWSICGGGCFLRWLSSDPNSYINSKYVKEVNK